MKNYDNKGKLKVLNAQKNKVYSHLVFRTGLFQTGQAKHVKINAILSQDMRIWLPIVLLYFAFYIFLMEITWW